MAKPISDEMYDALMSVADEAVRLKYAPKPAVDDKEEPSEENDISDDDLAELEGLIGKG